MIVNIHRNVLYRIRKCVYDLDVSKQIFKWLLLMVLLLKPHMKYRFRTAAMLLYSTLHEIALKEVMVHTSRGPL
jgi:hypothetical protein